ncbi:MAG: UDP-N-acetylglucosamine 2-epimerase (non-hydrolyzing) [Actinobacteria bacterium]|nr:UDP-N-acetylglucosamine 2-epimerase (non-hydrolyzing) [Actinomycetota bacterium]
MAHQKLLFVFGTRPETIKLWPVIELARSFPADFDVRVCFTGQHLQMVEPLLKLFGLEPDYCLKVMKPNQQLAGLTASLITELDTVLDTVNPDWIIVQGDTTTALAGAWAGFYRRIRVAHVEAGLRTGDTSSPFPEEMNRQVLSRLAWLHLAPTSLAREQLLGEGVADERICVTGNTVIDALFQAKEKFLPKLDLKQTFSQIDLSKRMLLITGHRRESFGQPFRNICWAIRDLLDQYPDLQAIYPVHLNPNVQQPVQQILAPKSGSSNMHLLAPLDYVAFVALLEHCHLVLTDSGGIQEEAPSLGKPVLVMRDNTERPEGVDAGTARLVGTDREGIRSAVSELLDNPLAYQRMAQAVNPYGDGRASERIVTALRSPGLSRDDSCLQQYTPVGAADRHRVGGLA